MTRPARLQLSRANGFRLQAASLELNGLPAVVVARQRAWSGGWGNPYKVGPAVEAGGATIPEITPARAVALYRSRLEQTLRTWPSVRLSLDQQLRGRNLACWCRLCPAHAAGKPLGVDCPDCAPCHADVLLELANR